MTTRYRATVVIPTYQRRDCVKRALIALTCQVVPHDEFEVIVCIDGSSDGTWEATQEFAAPYALRAHYQRNAGRAAACNAGIQAAQGEIVILLDDDMEPSPDFIAAHLHAQITHHGTGVMGAVPITTAPNDPPVRVYIARKFNHHLETLAQPGRRLGLRDIYTGNFSIPREILLDVGGFDEAFIRYGNEDLELAVRLRRAQVEIIYDPAALAYQHYTKTFADLCRDTVAKGHTSVLLADKHPHVTPELKLAHPSAGSRRQHFLRSCMLRLGLLWPTFPRIVTSVADHLLRWLPVGRDSLCTLTLDYLYWQGVQEARSQHGQLAPRQVVHFTDSVTFGGAEHAMLLTLDGLDRACWKPIIMYYASPGMAPFVEAATSRGIAVQAVPPMPEGGRGLVALPKFVRTLRATHPAVFHAHLTWSLSCKYALAGALIGHVPAVVATEHLYVDVALTASQGWQHDVIARRVHRFIAVSRGVAGHLIDDLRIPPRKVVVIPNGISLERFTGLDDGNRDSGAGNPATVLIPARLDPQKGHRYALEAAVCLPGVTFLLAGEGPERAYLYDLARDLGVSDRIHFLGHRSDIPELLAGSDLVCLPSLFEGLPLALLEAMAAAKPVVASNIPGIDEAVVDGETALLVPPGDSIALARAITRLLSDPPLAHQLGTQARARACEDFSSQVMAERIADVYRSLLLGGRRRGR